MDKQFVAIVADASTAQKINTVISRLLNTPVEVRTPGSIRRIATRVSEMRPDFILYSWSGDELGVLRWLKTQNLRPEDVRFVVFSYKGFGMDDAFAINRTIAWCDEVQPVAFAA